MIGALIADIAQKVAGNIAGGVSSYMGAQAASKRLRPRNVAGAEQAGAAGAYYGQALTRGALTRADIAPQIASVMDESAKTRRSLIEGLGSNNRLTSGQISTATQGVAGSTVSALRDVFMQQATLNLQARQQAAAAVTGASGQAAGLARQRDLALGQFDAQKIAGILGAASASKVK